MFFRKLFSSSLNLIKINQKNILKNFNVYKTSNCYFTLDSFKLKKSVNVFKANFQEIIGINDNLVPDLFKNKILDDKILKDKIIFLKKTFNKPENKIKSFFKDYPSLYFVEEKFIEKLNYHLIENLDLTQDDIFNHLWVFLFEEELLLKNIETLKNSPNYSLLDSSDKLKLIVLSKNYVDHFLNVKKSFTFLKNFSIRMNYFEEKFNCLPQQSIILIHRNPTLLFRTSRSIQKLTNFLLNDCKLDAKKIMKDIWIYNNGFEMTKLRAKKLMYLNYPIEVWLLRCQDDSYDKKINYYSREKNILNNLSKEDYFKNLLKCDDESLKKIRVDYFSVQRLDKIIKFYLNNGLTEKQILDHPKMLFFSIKTAKERIEVLKKYFIPDELLNSLTFSKKQFKCRISSYKKQLNPEIS